MNSRNRETATTSFFGIIDRLFAASDVPGLLKAGAGGGTTLVILSLSVGARGYVSGLTPEVAARESGDNLV